MFGWEPQRAETVLLALCSTYVAFYNFVFCNATWGRGPSSGGQGWGQKLEAETGSYAHSEVSPTHTQIERDRCPLLISATGKNLKSRAQTGLVSQFSRNGKHTAS